MRRYLGQERYRIEALGLADDFQDMGAGTRVMNFAEAQRAALAHKAAPRGVLTVAVAMADYVAWLKVHRATGEDAEQRAAKHILAQLGTIRVTDLTTVRLNNWRDALAEAGAWRGRRRVRTKNTARLRPPQKPGAPGARPPTGRSRF